MSDSRSRIETPLQRPEAAAWVARLHDPVREGRTPEGFRHWLGSEPGHQRAFSEATEVWEALGGAASLYRQRRRQRQVASVAASFFVIMGITLFGWLGTRDPGLHYQTNVGEQQFSILEDGSQVTLNTNSRVDVRFGERAREVMLIQGEALFDVSKDAGRPFIVHVGDREIRAIGTSFVVYRTADSFAVTLFEGKVSVGPHPRADGAPAPDADMVYLEPGQQWDLKKRVVQQLTPLQLDAVTQWRRQEVVFNDTPLLDAVAEMNRYTANPLVITDARLDGRSVSGVFRIGDTDSFINTLSALYGVTIVRRTPAVVQP